MFGVELREWLIKGCEAVSITISEEQVTKLVQYAELVIETNKAMNLTRIVEPKEFAIKHYVDSLLCTKVRDFSQGRGIDIGTGPGFPGIALAVYYPSAKLTLLDSLEKRIKFIQNSCTQVGVDNTAGIHGRAEEIAKKSTYRQGFDWGIARAVAGLPVLLEYCIPYIKQKGTFIALKSGDIEAELEASKRSCELLGAIVAETYVYELPFGMGQRSVIVYEKIHETPNQYPRKAGTPSKQPL